MFQLKEGKYQGFGGNCILGRFII